MPTAWSLQVVEYVMYSQGLGQSQPVWMFIRMYHWRAWETRATSSGLQLGLSVQQQQPKAAQIFTQTSFQAELPASVSHCLGGLHLGDGGVTALQQTV